MSITGLLVALCLIAIVCVIAAVIVRLAPMPAPLPILVWAIATIICILILLDCIQGSHYVRLSAGILPILA